MEKISAARYNALSRLVELPTELTIDIVSTVAAQLDDAIVDLRNLRATCKAMCMVGGAAMVGGHLALKRVLRRRCTPSPSSSTDPTAARPMTTRPGGSYDWSRDPKRGRRQFLGKI
jgi:hypothetical protein